MAAQLVKGTMAVTLMSALGAVSGVLVDAFVLAFFGLGKETDAFALASTVPLLIRTLIELEASKVVLPFFVQQREEFGLERAWGYLNLMTSCLTVVLSVLALVCILAARWICSLQAPGFTTEVLGESQRISQMMFVSLFLVAPMATNRVALNAMGSFVVPAAMRLTENIVRLVVVVALYNRLGIYCLAVGSVVGVAMQCAINYLVLFRMGYRFRLYLDWRDERLRKSGRLVTYLCLGHGASMVVEVVQNVMVSSLPSGAMSALRYATRLVESISGVLAGGTVAVTMAIVSCDIQRKEYAEMKRNLVRGIQLLMIVTLPLSLGLAMLNAPLIAALFERMRFTADSTRLVSVLLALMVPYIFFSRLVGLNQTVFFGMFDTRTPFVVTLLQSAGYLFLSLVLFQWVSVYAFPVARSLSYAAGAWSLGALIRRRFGAPEPEAGCPFVWKMMGCLAVMGLAIAGAQCAMRLLALQGIGARIGNLVVPTGVGVMALGGALLATRIARYEHLHALGKMFRLLKAER